MTPIFSLLMTKVGQRCLVFKGLSTYSSRDLPSQAYARSSKCSKVGNEIVKSVQVYLIWSTLEVETSREVARPLLKQLHWCISRSGECAAGGAVSVCLRPVLPEALGRKSRHTLLTPELERYFWRSGSSLSIS